jgi:hypothetical protein
MRVFLCIIRSNNFVIGDQMKRKILFLSVILVVAISFAVFLYLNLMSTPQESIERRITFVQQNKLDKLDISPQEISKIQNMLSLQAEVKPSIIYLNSPKSTEDKPIIAVFFTYIIPVDGKEIYQVYQGILEFYLSKISFNKWNIDNIKIIQELRKQK